MRRFISIAVAVSCASLVLQSVWDATPAHATFPGTNGLIAFTDCGSEGGCGIVTVQPDGSGVRGFQLQELDVGPAWSPDGTKLAFSASDGGPSDIAVSSPTGHRESFLAGTRGGSSPAWSPSGQRIVYTKSVGTNTSDLVIKNLVTGTVSQLTFNQRGVRSEDADWSPDGTRIVFSRQVGKRWRLFVMTLTGRQLTRLTGDALLPWSPGWSPDGAKVLFSGYTRSNGSYLYVVTLSTGHVDSLVAGYQGVWSPDGTMVAFSASGDGFVMPLGGSPTDILPNGGSEFFTDPAWQSTG